MVPAGKSLNVSRALAGIGRASVAGGLWGQGDIVQAKDELSKIPLIDPRFTAVPGRTRHNITLINGHSNAEMHLRCPNELATKQAMKLLHDDLAGRIDSQSICVFSGSIPDESLEGGLRLIRLCVRRGARIVVDTSSAALRTLVGKGGLWVIKPNLDELSELAGEKIRNAEGPIIRAARRFTDRAQYILISRGSKGAMVVSSGEAYSGVTAEKQKACHTVGCGDYLLAGFICGMADAEPTGTNKGHDLYSGNPVCGALVEGIRLAAFRAWGGDDVKSARKTADSIKVNVRKH
jgi:1-phosphofructokinase